MRRVYITGASGSGVTTLGRALAAKLAVPHVDVDDAYWKPSKTPFSEKRRVCDRIEYLRQRMGRDGWVLTGSFDGWGDPLVAPADLILFVKTPTPVRLARLKLREQRRFGDRIKPGGDMAAIHAGFMAWAACYDDPDFLGRNVGRHEDWLQTLRNPVLRLDGTEPTSKQVQRSLSHPALEAALV